MITVGMATIPERIDTLEMVLDSLVGQVDKLVLALNGFKSVPKLIEKYSNVVCVMTTNEMGDANKFFTVQDQDGYYFSCDDDIIYPPDYVKTYIPYINKGYLVSIHGADMPDRKIMSYYKGRTQRAHCLNNGSEVSVDIVGSGVSGFHTSFLKLDYKRFKAPNMADIWLSMQAHEQGVERLCIKHRAGWIKGGLNKGRDTIYDKHKNNDTIQTRVVNNFNWK